MPKEFFFAIVGYQDEPIELLVGAGVIGCLFAKAGLGMGVSWLERDCVGPLDGSPFLVLSDHAPKYISL